MKGKTRFKVLSLVLAFVFIFGMLSGCAKNGGGAGETTGGTTTAAADTTAKVEELPIVDIELYNQAVPGLDDPAALKKDRILQKINETLRINLKLKTAFDDEYIEKMRLGLAAGNSSDILCLTLGSQNSQVLYNNGMEEGLFVDMGEYVAKDPKRYAVLDLLYKDPMWKMMNLVDNKDAEKNIATHGLEYRRVPYGTPFFNMKVLTPLGLSVPTTFDEFVSVLRAIKKGNPKVIPFSYQTSKGTMITEYDLEQLFFGTHGTGVQQLVPDAEGYYHDYSTSDKTKEVVKIFVDLYKEGLIDKEIMTKEPWSNYYDLATGKTAVITCVGPYQAMYVGLVGEFKKNFPDATMEDIKEAEHPIKGPAGAGMTYETALKPTYSIVIPKSSKNPDRALDLLNYLYSDAGQRTMWYGVEGTHYKLDASGNITDFNIDEYRKDTGEIYYATSNKKRADWAPMSFMIGMGMFIQIEKAGSFVAAMKAGIDMTAERAEKTPELAYADQVFKNYQDEAYVENPPYVAFAKTSPAEQKVKQRLNDIKKKYFVPFLIGEKDLEKEWPNYVKEMNDAGIAEYEQAYNQAVKEAKEKYEALMK